MEPQAGNLTGVFDFVKPPKNRLDRSRPVPDSHQGVCHASACVGQNTPAVDSIEDLFARDERASDSRRQQAHRGGPVRRTEAQEDESEDDSDWDDDVRKRIASESHRQALSLSNVTAQFHRASGSTSAPQAANDIQAQAQPQTHNLHARVSHADCDHADCDSSQCDDSIKEIPSILETGGHATQYDTSQQSVLPKHEKSRSSWSKRFKVVAMVVTCAAAAVCAAWVVFDKTAISDVAGALGETLYRSDKRTYSSNLWETFRDYGAGRARMMPGMSKGHSNEYDGSQPAEYTYRDGADGVGGGEGSREFVVRAEGVGERRGSSDKMANFIVRQRLATRFHSLAAAMQAYKVYSQNLKRKRRVLRRKVMLVKRLQEQMPPPVQENAREQRGRTDGDAQTSQHPYVNRWDFGPRRQSLEPVEGQRGKMGWGLKNPLTGIPRVECMDTVSDGAKDANAFDDSEEAIALRERFQGNVGDTYTVECPANCGGTGGIGASLFGCGTYLDSSSICKAALAQGMLGMRTSGYVAFKLVEPVREYPGCIDDAFSDVPMPSTGGSMSKVVSFGWEWPQWQKADKPSKIKAYGPEKCFLKYRTSCYKKSKHSSCYGKRAFQIVETPIMDIPVPIFVPSGGTYVGALNLVMMEPDSVGVYPGLSNIYFTLDGSMPTIESAKYTQPKNFRAINTEKSIKVAAVLWTDHLPFYGDVVYEDYKVIPSQPGICDNDMCETDIAGNIRLKDGASSSAPETSGAAGENSGGEPGEEGAPNPVEPPGVELDVNVNVMAFSHESVGQAIVKVPSVSERVFFTVDGSNPMPGQPGTFECGVNPGMNGELEWTRQEFMERETVQEPDELEPSSAMTQAEIDAKEEADALYAAMKSVISFMTPDGCEMLMPPGMWDVKVVGDIAACEGCPIADSKVSEEWMNISDTNPNPDIATALPPTISVQIRGGNVGRALPMGRDGQRIDVNLSPLEHVYAFIECPENPPVENRQYSVPALPHYVLDDRHVNRFSERPKDGLVRLHDGEHTLKSVCYDPLLATSPPVSLRVKVTGGDESSGKGAGVGGDTGAGQNSGHEAESDKNGESSVADLEEQSIENQKTSTPIIRLQNGAQRTDPNETFRMADANGDGGLSFEEWKTHFFPEESQGEAKRIFDATDTNADGIVSVSEYIAWLEKEGPGIVPVIKSENYTKISPITGLPHQYTVDTVFMTDKGIYANIECPDPQAKFHYTINIAKIDSTSPTSRDSLVKINFGINYIRAVCYDPEMLGSEIASLEVIVIPQGSCLPGETFSNVTGGCLPCPEGTYKPNAGADECTSCSSGMTSPEGSTAHTSCACTAGWTPWFGRCKLCETGKYKDSLGSARCVQCPQDTTSSEGATEESQCECKPGYMLGSDGACTACPVGTYKAEVGAQACSACPENSHSIAEGSTFMTDCLCGAGYTGSSSLLPVVRQANGRYAQLPAPDPSEYPTVDSPVLCVACEAGKYKSNQGGFTQDACISCPANMDSADASVSQDQCRCEEGYSGPDGSGPCKAINSAMEQACTIRGQACFFNGKLRDCMNPDGHRCKAEGLKFLNMPDVASKSASIQMGVKVPPGKGCGCFTIPMAEDPSFTASVFS